MPSLTSPILATAVVPWTSDWKFDEPRFRQQVQHIARNLTRHIYIFGTAGEGHAVSDAQFRQIATSFFNVAQEEKVTPMAGLISLSLSTMIDRIEWARELGYREFQLSLPSWAELNDAEVESFFAETCGRFPDCRFLHYNLGRARRILVATDYAKLMAAHPNLVAVKQTRAEPETVKSCMELSPRLRFYFTERGYLAARRHGDCGLLISIASVNAARAKEYVAGDDAAREKLFTGIEAMGRSLREVSAGRFHVDGAFDKMLYRVSDRSFPLRLLPPYQYASDEEFERFVNAIPSDWQV